MGIPKTQTQILISILMESPLYLTMPLKERSALLSRLTGSYPSLCNFRGCDMSEETQTESSKAGQETFISIRCDDKRRW